MNIYDLPFVKNTIDNENKIDAVLVLLEDAYNQASTASITNKSTARLAKQAYDALSTFKVVAAELLKRQQNNKS